MTRASKITLLLLAAAAAVRALLLPHYQHVRAQLADLVSAGAPRGRTRARASGRQPLPLLLLQLLPGRGETWPSLQEAHIFCKLRGMSDEDTDEMLSMMLAEPLAAARGALLLGASGDLNVLFSNGGRSHKDFLFRAPARIRDSDSDGGNRYFALSAYYLHADNLNVLGEHFLFLVREEHFRRLAQTNALLRVEYGDACWRELLHSSRVLVV